MRTTIAVAFFCSIAFCPSSVWADCPDGVYNFTDADKKFMADTVAVLQAAVPPAPDGWQMYDVYKKPVRPGAPLPVWTPPNMSCKGADKVPLITSYDVSYIWVTGQKDLEQKQNEIRKRISVVQHTPLAADQQKLATELGTKDRDLRYSARKFEKTNKTEADRLKAEAAVYRKQYDQIHQAHLATLKSQLDTLQKEENDLLRGRDLLEMKFRIFVNSTGVDSRDLKPSNPQAGAATTLSDAKRTLLLYGGPWKKDAGSMLGVFQPGAKIQRVYNIYVEAQGDPKQAEALLSRMDGATLKALVGK